LSLFTHTTTSLLPEYFSFPLLSTHSQECHHCSICLDPFCLHCGKSGGFHWLQSFQHYAILRQHHFTHAQFICKHMLHSFCWMGLRLSAYTESVSILASGGLLLLGGISTNLFLSDLLCLPSWRRGFLLMTCRKCILITLATDCNCKTSVSVHDVFKMYSHCKLVTCMTIIEISDEGVL